MGDFVSGIPEIPDCMHVLKTCLIALVMKVSSKPRATTAHSLGSQVAYFVEPELQNSSPHAAIAMRANSHDGAAATARNWDRSTLVPVVTSAHQHLQLL